MVSSFTNKIMVSAISLLCLSGWTMGQTFTQITQQSGIRDLIAKKRAADTNWWSTGILLIDLDGDGHLDFFNGAHGGATAGGAIAALNDGHGVFTKATGTYPATEIHIPYDINEDGRIDLSMTYQDGGGQWWINNSTPGNLSFTATSITRTSTRTQAMIDVDGDGKVDWTYSGGTDLGNGAGGFTTSGITAAPSSWDIDGDGDLDRYTVDGGGYSADSVRSHLYRNDGNLKFTEITPPALAQTGMLIKSMGDMDQDGDIDIVAILNKTFPPKLFLNDGKGNFTEKPGAFTGSSGVSNYDVWGIGVITDFDNDGIADYIMNGRNFLHVYRGTGGGNFQYVNKIWKINDACRAAVDEGICFGDIDGDGDLDLIGYGDSYPAESLVVYRNDLPAKSWINVRPVGLPGHAGAAGSKIRVYESGTSQLLWFEQVAIFCKQSVQSYYAYSQTERHFGLGTRTGCDVEVEFFPAGKKVKASSVSKNTTVVINENGTVDKVKTLFGSAPRSESGHGGMLEAVRNPFDKIVGFHLVGSHNGPPPDARIFDLSGKTVARLAGEKLGSVIAYAWNSAGTPSGVYLARLDSDERYSHYFIVP